MATGTGMDEFSIEFSDLEDSGYEFTFVNYDGFECVICLKIIRNFVELPCGHAGCDTCIEQWEKKKRYIHF